MKRVLIAGANSYIGEAVRDYLEQYQDNYSISEIDFKELAPTIKMFESVDVVFCVTGIAHIKETVQNRHLYYDVNRDLVVKIAETAKKAGVKQFILLSSMAVYGIICGHITKATAPKPNTAYGESKFLADEQIKKLEDRDFIFSCLRPPMVYGKNCRGNYQKLRKFALHFPLFPCYANHRSMVYIGNLCEFVKMCIDQEKRGLFFPQNSEYVNTSDMVSLIAAVHGKKIILTKIFNWALKLAPFGVVRKVFGDLTYEKADLIAKYGFEESMKLTEG